METVHVYPVLKVANSIGLNCEGNLNPWSSRELKHKSVCAKMSHTPLSIKSALTQTLGRDKTNSFILKFNRLSVLTQILKIEI